MIARKDIRRGMVVMSRDGAVVGHVLDVNDEGLLIRAEDGYTHPMLGLDDIADVDVMDNELRLLLGRDQLLAARTTAATQAAVARSTGARADELSGGLHLSPREFEQARMDSAKFQPHAAPGTEAPRAMAASGPATGELRGNLGLSPKDLEEARMDSAKFQDHGQYDLRPGAAESAPRMAASEETMTPRRVAYDEEDIPRTSIPETDPNARYASPETPVSPLGAEAEADVPPRTSIPETDPNARYAGTEDETAPLRAGADEPLPSISVPDADPYARR